MSQQPVTANALGALVAGRYRVEDELGRGGMAVVYRVTDVVTGRQLALKQLVPPHNSRDQREATMLFEREFHTLTQLSHPHVIEVYDYGVDADAAYYTMELLDGKDLRDRSPMPWREACSLLYDVCSSLALLHSRRLVHRDITPRNIRCTRDGFAKLIDFGALVAMGSGGRVVGTWHFIAPEVVHRLATDARTDLFSLGATLYYALTGRPPYVAREFSDLLEAWASKPHPPSSLIADVPPALDALVMSLISLEPASRPRTAFEVMQRLAVIAGIERVESSKVARGYLATPTMVGRNEALDAVRDAIAAALRGRAGGVIICGNAGAGRSRMLDASVLEAKTMGMTVLRAGAASSDDFAVAQSLAEQLLEAFPNEKLPVSTQAAMCSWIVRLAGRRPIAIAVDDVHRIDETSAALLLALAHAANDRPLFLALTAESGAERSTSAALGVLALRCSAIELRPLSPGQTLELLESVFGDVPNVALVSARVHDVARGNPRECMVLAQHLVDKQLVVYEGGSWSLPGSLDAAALPSTAEQALRERIAAMPPLSRWFAEAQALACYDAFSLEEYAILGTGHNPQDIDDAISDLLSSQVLSSDGRIYTLTYANRAALTTHLDASERETRHRALAELYLKQGRDRSLAAVDQLLAAGLQERAVELLAGFLKGADEKGMTLGLHRMRSDQIAAVLERALEAAVSLKRNARELHDIRLWLAALSIRVDDGVYWRNAPVWLEQLERDSGLCLWRQLADVADPGERLRRALQGAMEQYTSAGEAERVYRPDEAIKFLVRYVVISIALGARTLDSELIASLPPLLEPFTPLSPLVEAMWQNAICTYEANCAARQNRARRRAAELYARLSQISETEMQYVVAVRNALAYCAGAIEAMLGLMSAMKWADILDSDPMQQVNAMHIRKIMRLQLGDPEGAEHFRKQAEILAAQASMRQMFTNTLTLELNAYALAHDLAGVKQTSDAIASLAETCPGWIAYRHMAEGHFERLRGNLEAALAAYECCLELHAPDPDQPLRSIATWPRATACHIEVLVELGRLEQARAEGERGLALAEQRELDPPAHDIARALALAEAKLGEYPRAAARLTEVIAQQHALGVTGLLLGASYEARARIAIWAGDSAAVEEYARLTAREYRHGHGSPLGVLYERLMHDARRAGVRVLPQLSEFESTMMMTSKAGQRSASALRVTQTMRSAPSAGERMQRALQLICGARGAAGGHLYLLGTHGPALVASYACAPATDDLREYVTRYLAKELEEPELATAIVTTPGEALPKNAVWTDSRGFVHEPLLLTCAVDGAVLCAGIAILLVDGAISRNRAGSTDIVAATAALLIEAGDTQAIVARF